MDSSIDHRELLLERIVEWGQSRPDICALAIVGSGARCDQSADEWSDIDLVLVAYNGDEYLQRVDWLEAISDPWITTVERNMLGRITEQRVLFKCGVDVDFIVLSRSNVKYLENEPLASIIRRGFRVLFDKEGAFPLLQSSVVRPNPPPTPDAFYDLVSDFWFHSIWSAKKLKRGELWTAKSCCDVYMKKHLLAMIEWHAQAHAHTYIDTWYNGRFVEDWAVAGVGEALVEVFAHYDEADIHRALLSTMALFHRIADDTARILNFSYDQNKYDEVEAWISRILE
jgi:aminoglycoside 6-adenylyltransferase